VAVAKVTELKEVRAPPLLFRDFNATAAANSLRARVSCMYPQHLPSWFSLAKPKGAALSAVGLLCALVSSPSCDRSPHACTSAGDRLHLPRHGLPATPGRGYGGDRRLAAHLPGDDRTARQRDHPGAGAGETNNPFRVNPDPRRHHARRGHFCAGPVKAMRSAPARETHWESAKAPMFPKTVWGSLCWELARAPRWEFRQRG
jgi:hypothetical protein